MNQTKRINHNPFFEYLKVGEVSCLHILRLCVFARVSSVWSFCGNFVSSDNNFIYVFGKKLWQKN